MASNDTEQLLVPSLNATGVIVLPVSTLSLMWMTYGVYIIVFGLSIHVLTHRRDSPAPKLYFWCTVSLFALNTIFIGFTAMGYTRQAIIEFQVVETKNWDRYVSYAYSDTVATVWVAVSSVITILMNVMADCMLIHRCHIIWDSRKSVLYPLVVVSFIINATLVGSIIPTVVGLNNTEIHAELFQKANQVNNGTLIAAAAFNFLLTLLTAGRISWISREVRKVMGRSTNSRYNTIVAIIIESGLLYSISLLAAIIFQLTFDPDSSAKLPIDLSVLSTQLSGLAPTMIIVRVAYNKSIQTVQPMVSTLNFVDTGQQVGATLDFRAQTTHPDIDTTGLGSNEKVV
ncbi:hypothetical protein L218DRAFT_705626 [Marasmius fiardii PR-910]|nr:hypothetical protein L218DRAFT_705626 [Marasmius fiardii PR-910]